MWKRIVSFVLSVILIVTFMGTYVSAGKTADEIIQQIIDTYAEALRGAREYLGNPDYVFNGECGAYVARQLYILGITTKVDGANGCDMFDKYKNMSKTSGGYSVGAYPVSNYSINQALNVISSNGTIDAYNIMVGFQLGSNGNAAGHVCFIHAIINGQVYFSDSYSGYWNGTYYSEGSPIVLSIDAFQNYYNSIYSFEGIIHFGGSTPIIINVANFPDEHFRAYIRNSFDADGDGVLNATELEYLFGIDCSGLEISSLKGIELFSSLSYLYCYDNQLKSLDVSKNTALERLSCANNQLTALDVSKNTALKDLHCNDNQLTSLDVSKNTELESLSCGNNQLTALNVNKNTALKWLYCNDNLLTVLDVRKNPGLLMCECGSNQLTSLDVSANIGLECLNCFNNQLPALDVSKNTALDWLGCAANHLTTLDVSKNTALERLSCANNQLTALDVSKNIALTSLSCYGNHLTAMDVSKNTALENLVCEGNQLTKLDVSKNTALKQLYCDYNQLKALDVSKNTVMEELWCDGNQLSALDVSKNTALKGLYCSYNQLTALDISKNTALERLWCNGNQIKTVDVSNNPMIEDVLLNGARNLEVDYYLYYNMDYSQAFAFGRTTVVLLSDGTAFLGNPFTDVPESKWYYDAVMWAYYHDPQITGGIDETHFGPNRTCTRAQVMTFLWKAYNSPEPASTENPFEDVVPGKYYEMPVLWAYYHQPQVTGGMNATTFGVKNSCTRAQVVMFLWAAAGKPEPTTTENPFSDVKEKDYFYKAVLWAVENGITGGTTPTTFSPKQTCTRAQVVTFLYKAVG